MHCLVTGGAGFIGSALVAKLAALGHKVRVLDDLSTGYLVNLAPDAPEDLDAGNPVPVTLRDSGLQVEFLKGDIRDAKTCAAAVADCETVFHLAAVRSVPRSFDDPFTTTEVNALGTLQMLVAARAEGVERFVSVSSSSVYGDSPVLPRVETSRLLPASPYAVSKLAAEGYVRSFFRAYGMAAVSLRYFNVYGPGQRSEGPYAGVIPKFAAALLGKRPLEIFGDGEQTRDFTYVADCVEATLLAGQVEAERIAGRSINVSAGLETSVNSLLAKVEAVVGAKAEVIRREPRRGDQRRAVGSFDLAAELLGWAPKTSLDQGLPPTIAWLTRVLGC